MHISPQDVKTLREKTGAGMLECKKALETCNGNSAEAEKYLKEKGLAAVEKRADRSTSEGRIFIKTKGTKTIICEVTCETDFVAKNQDFIVLGDKIAETALDKGYTTVNEELSKMLLDLATKIRENMNIRRLQVVETPADTILSKYIHSDFKTGVIIQIKANPASAVSNAVLKEFAYDCCLHVAAFTPAYVKRSDVDAKYIAEQTEIYTAQVADLDKPEKVKAGIIQGKLNKHLADICFMDQLFVKDDKVTVAKKMEMVGKEIGASLSLEKVITYVLGV